MTQSPLFSIIIPVYNVELYLKECLDSILNQSFRDYEVICVNDGSTDNSLSILDEYAKKDTRFKVLTQENQGQGVARNKALEIAQGEYILFVDPDDWIEENSLEDLHNYFQQTNAEVIEFDVKTNIEYSGKVSVSNLAKELKDKYGCDLANVPYYTPHDIPKGSLFIKTLAVWSRAYSKNFIDKIGAKFTPTRIAEDNLFANVVSLRASKIYYLNKPLYNYRVRKDSSLNRLFDFYKDIFFCIDSLKDYLINYNLYEEYEDDWKNYSFHVILFNYKRIIPSLREEFLFKSKEYLTPKEYRKLKAKIMLDNRSLLECIFSVKSDYSSAIKRKIITILGFKIKIKAKQKSKPAGVK